MTASSTAAASHPTATTAATEIPNDLTPIEKTLTSLIQQYLTLLLHDNATFLAERMVAHNPSPHANYLLAMCHYRSGSPKRARSVLVNFSNYDGITGMRDCIMYLLAKCCVDLELFNEAEDYLLKNAKMEYAQYKKNNKAPKDSNGRKIEQADGGNIVKSMEEWLEEMDGPLECPIPNGAAGYHLLGIICKRTSRCEKAAFYFQKSLGLDPMIWMSYEALCEMGVGPQNDPFKIFESIPTALMKISREHGGCGPAASLNFLEGALAGNETIDVNDTHTDLVDNEDLSKLGNDCFGPNHDGNGNGGGRSDRGGITPAGFYSSPILPSGDVTMHQTNEPSMAIASRLSFGATPSVIKGGGAAGMSEPTTPHYHRDMGADTSGMQGSSLFEGNISTIKRTTGAAIEGDIGGTSGRGSLPSASLFGSPITPHNGGGEHSVIARARRVAGRRYYEPSPETTPPNRIKTMAVPHSSLKMSKKKYRRRFIGLDYEEKGDDVAGVGAKEKRFLFSDMKASVDEERSMSVIDAAPKSTKKSTTSTKKLSRVREDGEEKVSVDRNVTNTEDGGVQFVLELLCTFGAAQRMLCSFKCKEALHILHTLPHSQFQTGWVQHQVGRAYFALVDYSNAQRALETMQQLDHHRMKGLELLSTTLYLLKKEVDLSNLAQRAVDFDRMSPETWCVVGNCFSLQKEHKTALAFFRRSIQLDPTFTYAHTLSGHEYVANEDFDHAVASFRNAIRIDERHYNAWNGLGEIYFRQEKYDLAEYHFQKGLSINPQSSVIRCNLGQAQHASGKHLQALSTLALVDQRNPQAQYQRANILISMDRLSEALMELEKVRDAHPREASVHFAMGRVLKRMGKPEGAMRCFLTALDLDPKENTLIKSAIDRLDEPDVDEDVSAF